MLNGQLSIIVTLDDVTLSGCQAVDDGFQTVYLNVLHTVQNLKTKLVNNTAPCVPVSVLIWAACIGESHLYMRVPLSQLKIASMLVQIACPGPQRSGSYPGRRPFMLTASPQHQYVNCRATTSTAMACCHLYAGSQQILCVCTCSFIFVLDGEVTLTTDDKSTTKLHADLYAYLPAGTVHR